MKIYLIDFENVKSKGLEGIEKLTETDSVIIFFSENSDTLSFEMHQRVLSSKADIEYFKVSVGGKNALDFQLSTLLGYMVAKETYSHIFVISNDKGFDFLHAFWGGNYIQTPKTVVFRAKTIGGAIEYIQKQEAAEAAEAASQIRAAEKENEAAPAVEAAQVKKKRSGRRDKDFDTTFTELIKDSCQPESYDTVKELFVASQTKEEFHNSLAKEYKQDGTAIYNAIKSRYLRLKDKYAQENPQQEQAEAADRKSDRLAEILGGICSQSELERVRRCFETTANKRELYISMIKEFQKKKGCEFYNAVKSQYGEIAGEGQEG